MGRVNTVRVAAAFDPGATENKGARVFASRQHRAQGWSCVLFDDGVIGPEHQEGVQLSVSKALCVRTVVRLVRSHIAELHVVEQRRGARWIRFDELGIGEIDSMTLLPANSAHYEFDRVVTLGSDTGVGIEVHIQIVAL